MKLTVLIKILLLILLAMQSCAILTRPYDSPYNIASSQISFDASSSSCFTKGGIVINLTNTTDKTIESLEIYFRLYTKKDSEYSPYPDYKSNIGNKDIDVLINANSTQEICISLDDKLATMPFDSLEVSPFIIKKIYYLDSSVWEDKYDIYKVAIQ